MKIAIFFLLLGTILAQTYIDVNCDNTCIERDDRNECVECSKLGCTPDGDGCRPFTCAWNDVLDDLTDQAYDVTCNWNELQDIAPKMSVDNGCSTTPIECNKSYMTSGNTPKGRAWKDLILYRQSEDCGDEPACPRGTTTRGTTCSLTCRSDGAFGGQRTCSMDPDKLELCKRRCVEGNVDCPDFSCHELQASWTGDFKGGKWDVCWDPYYECGEGMKFISTEPTIKCCDSEILGIGQGELDVTMGMEAGCLGDDCWCSRYTKRTNKCKCPGGAMSLSLVVIVVAISFMI